MPRSLAAIVLLALSAAAIAAAVPPSASRVHPAASAHATAVAGLGNATRIEACVEASDTFLGNLAAADYEAATSNFGSRMRSDFGTTKLGAAWQSVTARYGKLESHGVPQSILYQDFVVVTVPLHFQNGNLGARLACDASGKFAGFHMVPAPATTSSVSR